MKMPFWYLPEVGAPMLKEAHLKHSQELDVWMFPVIRERRRGTRRKGRKGKSES